MSHVPSTALQAASTSRKSARVRVELFGSKLKNVAGAFKGTSDPYAIVTRLGDKPGDAPQILGRTEVIKNNLSPHWTTHFDLEYTLGRQTRINVGVYDEVRKAAVDKPMGSAVFEVGDILGSRGNVKAKKLRKGGTIFCRITPAPTTVQGHVCVSLRGLNLKATGNLRSSKPSPFFEVAAQTTAASGLCWRTVYRSEPIVHHHHPIWPPFQMDLGLLVNTEAHVPNSSSSPTSKPQTYEHTPLRIQVWDHQKSGKHRNMGRVETTLHHLRQAQRPAAMRTDNPQEVDVSQALLLRVKDKDVGQLIVGTIQVTDSSGGCTNPQSAYHPSSSLPAHVPPHAHPTASTSAVAPPLNNLKPLVASLPETTSPPHTLASSLPCVPSTPPSSFLGYDDLPPAMAPPPARPQFVDYISGGCELELCIAIDFTGSNGDPRVPGTLHFMHPRGGPLNDYEKAILAVGSILAKYDSDQKFPVWGFGAKYNGIIQHCFRIGDADELSGLNNVLEAYRKVFETGLTMSGPTVLDEVIHLAAAKARSQHQMALSYGSQAYKILLILTDGAVTDVEATKRAIQAASDAPLSIVIVGIGDADFSAMQFLDDFQTDIGGGRDICQFVEFRKYQNDKSALAEKTLEEVPRQLVDFFYTRGIMPMPPRRLSQTSLSNIEVEDAGEEDIDLSIGVDSGGGLYLASEKGTFYDETVWSGGWESPRAYTAPSSSTSSTTSSFPSTQLPNLPVAQAVATPSIFYVQSPAGSFPGQQLRINHPGTGQPMVVTIPAGVLPGGKFGVRY